MGHIRLGQIPKTREWGAVVAAVGNAGGGVNDEAGATSSQDSVATIAAKTLLAAQEGLARAIDDAGLRFTFYLLAQIVVASRTARWREHISTLGIELPPDVSLFDLTGRIHERVDRYLSGPRQATDVSEIAQKALADALYR